MNVFVLCTGRCGSMTFVHACTHITNYTAAHESRTHLIGSERLAYPPNHIEADNRLSWLLGRLDRAYGDRAAYVHLTRDTTETARSYAKRWTMGIIRGYRSAVIWGLPQDTDRMALCLDYCDTVNSNIDAFLKDKTKKMRFSLETGKADFEAFWSLIGAEGDLASALREWETPYNPSKGEAAEAPQDVRRSLPAKGLAKALRVVQKFPTFLRTA